MVLAYVANLQAGTKEDLGIELRGGRDDPMVGTQVSIYVKSVTKGGKLDGHLRMFDCITQVNDIDVSNMEHRSVMDILRNSKHVKMVSAFVHMLVICLRPSLDYR